MKTLNRDIPFEDVGVGRNWRYVQGGRLYNVNGIECGSNGKVIGDGPVPAPVIEPPKAGSMTIGKVEETEPLPEKVEVTGILALAGMTDDELKAEMKAGGISTKGGMKRATLIKKVEELRNVAT